MTDRQNLQAGPPLDSPSGRPLPLQMGIYTTNPDDVKAMVERYKHEADEAGVNALTELFTLLTETQRENLILRGQCQAFQISLRMLAGANPNMRRQKGGKNG